jgi:hypothetical protein
MIPRFAETSRKRRRDLDEISIFCVTEV